MEFNSTSLVDSFSQFLSEITAEKKVKQGSLISYASEINFKFEDKLDSILKSSENSFYFSSPERNLSFVSLDQVYSIDENGPARFSSTDKKIKVLSGNVISNLDMKIFPLFAGAMKFTVEHSDDDWKDYNDSSWFVPEIIFCNSSGKDYIIYNYFVEHGLSKIKLSEKFEKKISIINNLKNDVINNSLHIVNSNGLSPKDKKKWKLSVNEALEKIHNNEIKKIVLSRKVELVISSTINFSHSLNSLKKEYPDCFIFAFHRGNSTFFGATPESLAEIYDKKIIVDAIAGSAKRGATNEEDILFENELLKSSKNIAEHSYVVEHIKETLRNFSAEISFDENPSVKKLKNIQLLSPKISAVMKTDVSVMNLLKELHPTPAVCGYPKEAALNFIKKTEMQKRGLYSGITGWFNLNGEGEFAVALRSAVAKGNKLSAYAGCGIVEDSVPDTEFEETEMKLKPILSLFSERS